MDTDDLPEVGNPHHTLFTPDECSCVIHVVRTHIFDGECVLTETDVLTILQRCELHDFLRYELHNNSIEKEQEHFARLVEFHDQK